MRKSLEGMFFSLIFAAQKTTNRYHLELIY